MNNALAGGPTARLASQTVAGGVGIAGRVNQALPLVFRSVALFAILYQFRLLAGNLADTSVYVTTLLGAFAAAIFLAHPNKVGKMGPIAALVSIALVPWAIRLFIAMPRFLIPGRTDSLAITLDALLLNFDRNNFVSLLPFYWAAATTWFSLRSRLFLRGVVIADAILLIAIFTFAPIANIEMYRWPIVVISVVAGIIFLQAMALLFSMPKGTKLQKGEKITATVLLLLLVVLGGLVFLGPAQERAVQRGGGLLEPRGLFSFDFSQVLSLNPEISMSDDLVLIVRMDPPIQNALLRRAVMSGYDRRQGFFRIEELDERTHPQRVPNRPTEFPAPDLRASRRVSQELFLVNFEATALIGMKQPVEVIPFETWDASSFRAAYAVESEVINFNLADFILGDRGGGWPSLADFGLSEREFAMYTYYGNNERLNAFAREITAGYDLFHEKILAIYTHLKFGDYRYSLRPGIAPDGDQLAWFLFYAKRGYCTYFAFAMTLMLRSLGIPARVAAGFFVDPGSSVFNYYAIRADMAHAWVEVLFPATAGWNSTPPRNVLPRTRSSLFPWAWTRICSSG
ncbi:MAG: transglutaminase-like domain-containing protein [Treponema sp.]|nr:transglutaminase-like domain-containing protein [Treponema sp.]